VATHLAIALHEAGHPIEQVFSREYDHAALLAGRVNAEAVDKRDALRTDVDVLVLAVSDDALYDLALDLPRTDALILHTSGSTPAGVLKPLSPRYGVVWSPQTFVRDIAMDYSALPLCIEGSSPEVEEQLSALASDVSRRVFHLDYEQRRWAHLAAVMVCNFGNAINALAQEMMESRGMDFTMLRPLALATAAKMDFGPLWPQQTGPAVRHDNKTLDLQRRLLAPSPELLHLYETLTEIIQDKTRRDTPDTPRHN
jgi:predicted short-subunit dehydrogenase-like oxidoreductase (DUF2520 family)